MLKNMIFLSVGLLFGGFVGFQIGKKTEGEKFQKQLEELDEYYKKSDRYTRKEPENEEELDENSRENGPLNDEQRKIVKEKIKNGLNAPEMTDYTSYYVVKKEETEDISEEEETDPGKKAIKMHETHKNDAPELVSEDALGSVPDHFDHQVLFFYSYDETLCDEDYAYIDEPGYLVGTVLEDCGFMDDDASVIFVANYQTDCLYEIQKVAAAYGDEHEVYVKE